VLRRHNVKNFRYCLRFARVSVTGHTVITVTLPSATLSVHWWHIKAQTLQFLLLHQKCAFFQMVTELGQNTKNVVFAPLLHFDM
jgi:hypothetical protein